MTTQALTKRVDSLEGRVTRLEELPARVDALTLQVSQLRDEMRVEFSAIRDEIRTGDADIMDHARALHEDVIARLALIQEGGAHRRKRSGTKGNPQ